MTQKFFKRGVSLLLALFMVVSVLSGAGFSALALYDDGHFDHEADLSGGFLYTASEDAHLIINQAAGVGKNADGAISHSFVEIYNPTEDAVDLTGMSLQYAENGSVWEVLPLSGIIPAKHSYLVRMNGSTTSSSARYVIYYTDRQWDIVISNDSYKFALVDSTEALSIHNPGEAEGIIDLVGAFNAPAIPLDYGEGGSPAGGMSKQKSVRRINLADTDRKSTRLNSSH